MPLLQHDDADLHLIFAGMRIVRAECLSWLDVVEYVAYSDQFEPVLSSFINLGTVPTYQCVITRGAGKRTTVEWKKESRP